MNRYIISCDSSNDQTPIAKTFHEAYGLNAKAAKTLFEIQHPELKVEAIYPTQNPNK